MMKESRRKESMGKDCRMIESR